ncbi:unnamed protein product [Urochloa decumbens]|uniref:Protein TIFY n=1 Tax=Urochloa decumbens TaxID=240449 RepID=A0ABC8XYS6_9POAL
MAAEGSGRGRRARFAVTCALMQRYMRENQRRAQQGGNNNLAAGRLLRLPPPPPLPAAVAPPSWENGGDRRTMQLFPVRAGGAAAMAQPAPQQRPPELMRAPMTIFYGGQVITVENVPVDKGHQLVHMVARSSVVNAPPRAPPEVVVLDVPEDDDDEPEVIGESSAGGNQQGSMARKASLERFLRKRKRRVNGGFDPEHNEDAWPPAKKMDAGSGGEPFEDDVPDALWLRL